MTLNPMRKKYQPFSLKNQTSKFRLLAMNNEKKRVAKI